MCLSIKHAEVAFVDESLREDDHLGVAGQALLTQFASASIWFSSWLQPGEDYFRQWHGWFEGYSGGKPSRVPTLEGPSLLLHSATSWAAYGMCWVLYKERTSSILWRSSRWQDVNRCIGGWAGAFWRGRFGCAAAQRESSFSVSGSQDTSPSGTVAMERHGESRTDLTPDHTHRPLSPAGSSGRFENVKGPTHAPPLPNRGTR